MSFHGWRCPDVGMASYVDITLSWRRPNIRRQMSVEQWRVVNIPFVAVFVKHSHTGHTRAHTGTFGHTWVHTGTHGHTRVHTGHLSLTSDGEQAHQNKDRQQPLERFPHPSEM